MRCKRLWRKKKESRRAAQAALIGKIGILPVAGDRVKREGHCSEYEKSEIAKEK